MKDRGTISREAANTTKNGTAREAAKIAKKSKDPDNSLRAFAPSRDPLVVYWVESKSTAREAAKIAKKSKDPDNSLRAFAPSRDPLVVYWVESKSTAREAAKNTKEAR